MLTTNCFLLKDKKKKEKPRGDERRWEERKAKQRGLAAVQCYRLLRGPHRGKWRNGRVYYELSLHFELDMLPLCITWTKGHEMLPKWFKETNKKQQGKCKITDYRYEYNDVP